MKTQTSHAIGLFAVCLTMAGYVLLTAGCGRSGPTVYQVSGTATCDGKPIEQGNVIFRPLNKDLGPEGGAIKDGRFEAKAKEGRNKVEITALKIIGHMGDTPMTANFIPARYNEKSELEVEVSSDNKTFEFDVQSE